MEKTREYFKSFCRKKGLKRSVQRDNVVSVFLATEEHLSAFDLYDLMRRKKISIGYSTIYRALKLLVEAGVAREINFGDELHFEHKFGHKHHDHFLCQKCGKAIEFSSPKIEKMQDKLARKYHFAVQKHSLILYGLCKECRKT
jgi:Fur family ferric uptake transcriptional regulator